MPTRTKRRQKRRSPTPANDLRSNLGPTRKLNEVLLALVDAGLRVEEIAALTGSSESSVHKWMQGKQEPRNGRVLIDELRAIVLTMLNGGLEAERVVSWLRARQLGSEPLAKQRPIEILPQQPLAVMAAAEQALIDAGYGLGGIKDEYRSELLAS